MGIEISRRGVLAGGAIAVTAPQVLVAPPARAQQAATAHLVYPRKVGELEITAISDGHMEFPGSLFVNIEEDELTAALTAAFIDPAAPTSSGNDIDNAGYGRFRQRVQ